MSEMWVKQLGFINDWCLTPVDTLCKSCLAGTPEKVLESSSQGLEPHGIEQGTASFLGQ